MYETRDYMVYREKALRHLPADAAGIAEYFQRLGVKIGNNLFTGLDRVSPADLHKLDLLHNIYCGLFKHMIQWVEGFLKTHKRQQAFNDAWKEIPPYTGFSVLKKAYRKITMARKRDAQSRPLYFSRIGVRIVKSGQFLVSGFQDRFEVS